MRRGAADQSLELDSRTVDVTAAVEGHQPCTWHPGKCNYRRRAAEGPCGHVSAAPRLLGHPGTPPSSMWPSQHRLRAATAPLLYFVPAGQ